MIYRQAFDKPCYLKGTKAFHLVNDTVDAVTYQPAENEDTTASVCVIELELGKSSTRAWCNGRQLNSEGNLTSFSIPMFKPYISRHAPMSTLSPWVIALQLEDMKASLVHLSIEVSYTLQKDQTNDSKIKFEETYEVPTNDASLPLTNDVQSFVPIVVPCLLKARQLEFLNNAASISSLLKRLLDTNKQLAKVNALNSSNSTDLARATIQKEKDEARLREQIDSLNVEIAALFQADQKVSSPSVATYTLHCTWIEDDVSQTTNIKLKLNTKDHKEVDELSALPIKTLQYWIANSTLLQGAGVAKEYVEALETYQTWFLAENEPLTKNKTTTIVKLKSHSAALCPKYDVTVNPLKNVSTEESAVRSTLSGWLNHLTPVITKDILWNAQLQYGGCMLRRFPKDGTDSVGREDLLVPPKEVRSIGTLAGTIPYQLAKDQVCARVDALQAASSSIWYSSSRTALHKHGLVSTSSDVQDYIQSSLLVGTARLLLLEEGQRSGFKLQDAAGRMASEPWINRSTARALQTAASWLLTTFGHEIPSDSNEWKVVQYSIDLSLYTNMIGVTRAENYPLSLQRVLASRLSTLAAMDLPCYRALLQGLVYANTPPPWTAACALEMRAFCNGLQQMMQRAAYGESLYTLPVSFLQESLLPALRNVPNASKMAELVRLRQRVGDPGSNELMSSVEDLSRGFKEVTLDPKPKTPKAIESLQSALRAYERNAATPLRTRETLATRAVESDTQLFKHLKSTIEEPMIDLLYQRRLLANRDPPSPTTQTYTVDLTQQAPRVPLWNQVSLQWSNMYLRPLNDDLSPFPPLFVDTNPSQPMPCLFYAPPGWLGGMPATGKLTVDETPLDVVDLIHALEDMEVAPTKGESIIVQASTEPLFLNAPSVTTLLLDKQGKHRAVHYRRVNLEEPALSTNNDLLPTSSPEQGSDDDDSPEQGSDDDDSEYADAREQSAVPEFGELVDALAGFSNLGSVFSYPDTLDAYMWNIVRLSQSMLLAASLWHGTRREDESSCLLRINDATHLETAVALSIARSALGAIDKRNYKLQARVEASPSQSTKQLKKALLDWTKNPQALPSRAISLATITTAVYMCEHFRNKS